jgi:hypothetical protein
MRVRAAHRRPDGKTCVPQRMRNLFAGCPARAYNQDFQDYRLAASGSISSKNCAANPPRTCSSGDRANFWK